MKASLSVLVDRYLATARRRRRLAGRHRPSAPPRLACAGSPLPPRLHGAFCDADFDPADLVLGYVNVPGACMADMEDGEQPFGPPSPSFAYDDLELLHTPALRPARAA